MIKFDHDSLLQDDLSTFKGKIAPGVENAPYYLIPIEECESCYTEDGEYPCAACYKCCRCEWCDSLRSYKDIFVCKDCGCRVWQTGCYPYLCICVKDCNCTRCCEEVWDGPDVGPVELLTLGESRVSKWGGTPHNAPESYLKVNSKIENLRLANLLISDLQTKAKKKNYSVTKNNTTFLFSQEWLQNILNGLEIIETDIKNEADNVIEV